MGTSHPLGRLWEGRQVCCLGEGNWRPNLISLWWVARFLSRIQWPHRSHLEIPGAKGDARGTGDWVSHAIFYVGGSTLICLYFRVPGQGKIKNSLGSLGSLDLRLFQTHVKPHAHPLRWFPLNSKLVKPGIVLHYDKCLPTMPSRAFHWATILHTCQEELWGE